MNRTNSNLTQPRTTQPISLFDSDNDEEDNDYESDQLVPNAIAQQHASVIQTLAMNPDTRLDPEWKKELKKMQINQYTCIKCGNRFKDIDNVGAWNCPVGQHAYESISQQLPGAGNLWPCCKKPFKVARHTDKGCVRADHTIWHISWSTKHDYRIPEIIPKHYFNKSISIVQAQITKEEYIKSIKKEMAVTTGSYDTSSISDDAMTSGQMFIRRFDKKAQDRLLISL